MEKNTLFSKRQEFFNEMIQHLSKPPSQIDSVLNQAKYYLKPDLENVITSPENGDVAIPIKGNFFNKSFQIYYTIWQFGHTLKIGIAIYDEELHGAFASDSHNEVYSIWGKSTEPQIDVAHGCVFYDWEFDVPKLYESYQEQEKFILGLKHMHFRTMRILYDECHRLSVETSTNDDVQEFEKHSQ